MADVQQTDGLRDRDGGRATDRSFGRGNPALLWPIAAFLFVLLLLFALFLYTGVFVLRNSQGVVAALEDLQDQVAAGGFALAGVSNRLATLEGVQHRLIQKSAAESTRHDQAIDVLRGDVQRFSRWIAAREGIEERIRADVGAQVRVVNKAIADLEQSVRRTEARMGELPTVDAIESAVNRATQPPQSPVALGADETVPEVALLSQAAIEQFFADALAETTRLAEAVTRPSAVEVSVVVLPNGDRYQGEMSGGLFSGWGRMAYKNGDTYEGHFEKDLKHGAGTFVSAVGERYTGEYRNDMRSGRGSLYLGDGRRYIGDFREDQMTGKGVMLYPNGDRFAGELRAGKRTGKGVMLFSNGDIYQGEFRDDVRAGQGAYLFVDGSKYIGEFKDGLRDGQGRFVYPDGAEYRGAFQAGKKHGQGYRVYPNGVKLKGLWEEDKYIRDVRE
jgi:hypothetical protein